MEELLKGMETRIKELREVLEQGNKEVTRLNLQRDLQQVDNERNEDEISALMNLVEVYNLPKEDVSKYASTTARVPDGTYTIR